MTENRKIQRTVAEELHVMDAVPCNGFFERKKQKMIK